MGRPDLDRLDDWLFGSVVRRRLLTILTGPQEGPWRQVDLAEAAGVSRKGTVEGPLHRLQALGLVTRRADGRWERGEDVELADAVRRLITELERAVEH